MSNDVRQRMLLPHHRAVDTYKPKRERRPERWATFAVPSVSAGSFKATKLTVRGKGRPNLTVRRARDYGHTHTTNVKQPGRRYGPSPESTVSGQGRTKRPIIIRDETTGRADG